VLDGEIVALDEGRPVVVSIAPGARVSGERPPIFYACRFDPSMARFDRGAIAQRKAM